MIGKRPFFRCGVAAAIAAMSCACAVGVAGARSLANVCTQAGVTTASAEKAFGVKVAATFRPSNGSDFAWCQVVSPKSTTLPSHTVVNVGAQIWLYPTSMEPGVLSSYETKSSVKATLAGFGKGAFSLFTPASRGTTAGHYVFFIHGPYFVAIAATNSLTATPAQLLALARMIHSKLA